MMLNAGRMFDAAARDCGLGAYADDAMRERFAALVERFNTNGPIPEEKHAAAEDDFRTLVTHRLMVERDWWSHPQIANERIDQPIFIVGNPRTGTTILQCLLAEDENNRILHYWQSHYPSPAPGAAPQSVQARIAATDRLVRELVALMPIMLPCHPYLDRGGMAELEDEELFTLDFQSTFPFHFLHVPNVPIGATPADPLAALQFHKRMLQHFQWRSPTKRWVCKGTAHQFNLAALWDVYPDAICIWPHREPAEFLGSMLEMIAILYGPITGRDYRPFGIEMMKEIKAGYDHILSTPQIDDPRLVHLTFRSFMADQAGSIRAVYDRFGIPFSPEFEGAIRRWLADPAHASDRHGRFHYAIEDFGFSRQQIGQMFQNYRNRFGLN